MTKPKRQERERPSSQPSLLAFFGKKTAAKSREQTAEESSSSNDNSYGNIKIISHKRKRVEATPTGSNNASSNEGSLFDRFKHKPVTPEETTSAAKDIYISNDEQQPQEILKNTSTMDQSPPAKHENESGNILDATEEKTETENKTKNYRSFETNEEATSKLLLVGKEEEKKEEKSNKNEEEKDSSNQTKTTTSTPNKNNTGNSEGLSEYELLRQRNIARNNERLRALGLLSYVEDSKPKATKPSRPKKRPKKEKAAPVPVRRSTRLARSDGTTNDSNTSINQTKDGSNTTAAPIESAKEDTAVNLEEQYDVSPVVQYTMENAAAEKQNSSMDIIQQDDTPNNKTISTLAPTVHRLSPPQGLSHIYSLNYYESDNNWLVGAGKSGIVALWNCQDLDNKCKEVDEDGLHYTDPVFSWKAHGGRWISEAQFLTTTSHSDQDFRANTTSTAPSRLLTAANDGTVCLWDLSQVSTSTGVPKILSRSDKLWHSSGIFAMDVNVNVNDNSDNAYPKIATGSKDKTVAVAMLDDGAAFVPTWRSEIHTKTVKAVKFRDRHVLATASDDGCVALLDDRMSSEAPPIELLEGLHDGRPHSVLWDPHNANLFLTAGLDTVICSWDMRYLKEQSPVCEYHGHVPVATTRCKRIHQPVFYNPSFLMSQTGKPQRFILTGGEGSHALSMFQHCIRPSSAPKKASVFSRGTLPQDCNHGDTGSIAVRKDTVAISVEGGEVLLLEPTYQFLIS